jgi:uracil-DNA glycosylase
MLTCDDAPKTLRIVEERMARLRALLHEHIAPLTSFVDGIRGTRDQPEDVPYFDPCDGGVAARVLFLLEAPGRRARGSGFVSRNNPDETAKNMFELQREVGLRRELTVLWNIVPWYVGTGERLLPVRRTDIEAASGWLNKLLAVLPDLRAVVLVGRNAERAAPLLTGTRLKVLVSPHPSPQALRTRPEKRVEILKVWSKAAKCFDRG